jgi:hypothetical protein
MKFQGKRSTNISASTFSIKTFLSLNQWVKNNHPLKAFVKVSKRSSKTTVARLDLGPESDNNEVRPLPPVLTLGLAAPTTRTLDAAA